MDSVYNKYQLGSYLTVDGGKIGTVIGMCKDSVTVMTHTDNLIVTRPWDKVKPIPLTVEYMTSIGFSSMKKVTFVHHLEYNTDIRLNGRFYFSRGVVFRDRSIWTFNSISVTSVHQIQSVIWIISPEHQFPAIT